jgi:hypothetical protein
MYTTLWRVPPALFASLVLVNGCIKKKKKKEALEAWH